MDAANRVRAPRVPANPTKLMFIHVINMIKALKIIRLIMTHYDYNVILIMLAIFEQ